MNHRTRLKAVLAALLALACLSASPVSAEPNDEIDASPHKPWGEFTVDTKEESAPWWEAVLLWVPNRILDFIDIFRVDVGAGPSFGAVARITKYGQVGYRTMSPASVRIGDFGRKLPVLVERTNEFGAGPGFLGSKDRSVCPGEIGVGADIFIVGAYGGFCVEEIIDFAAGLFFFDLQKDDIR